MNFKDIDRQDIIKFLTLNNQPISDDLYNDAIQLINNNDIKMTNPINLWLIAYEYKDFSLKPYKSQDLSYYKTLFKMSDVDSVIILKYLHLYIDDFLSLLPLEIISTIMIYMQDFRNIACINKLFNQYYKLINKDCHFWYLRCQKLLIKNNYNINIDKNLVNKANNLLNCPCGQVLNIKTYEPISKVMNLNHCILMLTQSGKLITDDLIVNIPIVIHDIIYNYHYYILSEGKIYMTNQLLLSNRYDYKSRCHNFDNHLTVIKEIDNIVGMTTFKNEVYFLKVNGELYSYSKSLTMIDNHVKDCQADEFNLYILKFDNQLSIDNILTNKYYKKIIPGDKILLINNEDFGYIYDNDYQLYCCYKIKYASINESMGYIYTFDNKLYSISKYKMLLVQHNIVNLYLLNKLYLIVK